MIDAEKIRKASTILYPHTCHALEGRHYSAQQAAINDAFNVLEWDQTIAEERESERNPSCS